MADHGLKDMNDLVNEIAAFIDLRFVKQQVPPGLPTLRLHFGAVPKSLATMTYHIHDFV